jgi:hypothetical protein
MKAPEDFFIEMVTNIHKVVCDALDVPKGTVITPLVGLRDLEDAPLGKFPQKAPAPDTFQLAAFLEWEGLSHATEVQIPATVDAIVDPVAAMRAMSREIGIELVRLHKEGPSESEDLPVFDFSGALYHLKNGRPVRRKVWIPGVAIVLVPGSDIVVGESRPLAKVVPVGTLVTYGAHIDMIVGTEMFPWACTTDNLLATDWCLTE